MKGLADTVVFGIFLVAAVVFSVTALAGPETDIEFIILGVSGVIAGSIGISAGGYG